LLFSAVEWVYLVWHGNTGCMFMDTLFL